MKYRFVAIEGNIGAGKTTLARILSERTGAIFLPEQFEENPFLRGFYEDPERFAFTVELSFLEERFRHVSQTLQAGGPVISDYLWEKSVVFARTNLKGAELQLFERLYKVMAQSIPVPDLVIYLHKPVDILLRQIDRRGRDFEKDIQPEYLQKISAGYQQFFAAEKRMPVLWLQTELGPEALADHVQKLADQDWNPGFCLVR